MHSFLICQKVNKLKPFNKKKNKEITEVMFFVPSLIFNLLRFYWKELRWRANWFKLILIMGFQNIMSIFEKLSEIAKWLASVWRVIIQNTKFQYYCQNHVWWHLRVTRLWNIFWLLWNWSDQQLFPTWSEMIKIKCVQCVFQFSLFPHIHHLYAANRYT